MSDFNANTVLDRLKEYLAVKKDADLARRLSISPQTLSSWRQRDAIPYSLCLDFARREGISLEWVLYGEGPMLRRPAPSEAGELDKAIPSIDATAVGKLTTSELNELLKYVETTIRLRTLEGRIDELAAVVSNLKRPRDTD